MCIRDRVITAHEGRIVKHEGDGVFAAFDTSNRALGAAVEIQRILQSHRDAHGFAPRIRIGLHRGPATERDGDYFGMAVNITARVMALTDGNTITATEETVVDYTGPHTPPRSTEVKGLTTPLRVVVVDWTG